MATSATTCTLYNFLFDTTVCTYNSLSNATDCLHLEIKKIEKEIKKEKYVRYNKKNGLNQNLILNETTNILSMLSNEIRKNY